MTEQYKCQSYYDGETDSVKDCTCGRCEAIIERGKSRIEDMKKQEETPQEKLTTFRQQQGEI